MQLSDAWGKFEMFQNVLNALSLEEIIWSNNAIFYGKAYFFYC